MLVQDFYRPVLCDRLIIRCGIKTKESVIFCVTVVRDATRNSLADRRFGEICCPQL
jgi:hypothetical protein